MPTPAEIEQWLLSQPSWVSADDLCTAFGIGERELRSDAGAPGLCTDFAISGPLGYKHVRNASTREWLGFKFRILRHAVSEFRRIRHLAGVRHSLTRAGIRYRVEADSGQTLLPV